MSGRKIYCIKPGSYIAFQGGAPTLRRQSAPLSQSQARVRASLGALVSLPTRIAPVEGRGPGEEGAWPARTSSATDGCRYRSAGYLGYRAHTHRLSAARPGPRLAGAPGLDRAWRWGALIAPHSYACRLLSTPPACADIPSGPGSALPLC